MPLTGDRSPAERMSQPVALILAAGKGTRMQSDLPKVLHEIAGRPMVEYVLDTARAAGAERLVVIVGHQADLVRSRLSHRTDVEFALQTEQLGTGHAVQMCADQLATHDGPVLVLAGDTPLLKPASLAGLLAEQKEHSAACVIGTAVTKKNEGLGRVVRNEAGDFERIVEQKDCSPAEAAIEEINTGCYVFDSRQLLAALKHLRPNNQQGELYLTDCPAVMLAAGETVVASCRLDIQEAIGINTPAQLAEVAEILAEQNRSDS